MLKSWSGVSDVCFWLILFIAPLLMGGRHPVGRLILTLLVVGATAGWLLDYYSKRGHQHRWTPLGPSWLGVCGVLLVVAQLLPISPKLLASISPGHIQLLPAWFKGDASLWQTISVVPYGTRQGLTMSLTYALLFIFLWQRIDGLGSAAKYLRWLGQSCLWLAAIGLAQLVAGNGRFLWIYAHPTRDTFGVTHGPFQNQNHFGHMMVMGLAVLVWWVVSSFSINRSPVTHNKELGRGRLATKSSNHQNLGSQWVLPTLGCFLLFFAGFLTFSRGTLMGMGVCLVVALLGHWRKGSLPTSVLLASLGGFVMVGGLATWSRADLWRGRMLSSLETRQISDLSPARFELWRADLQAHSQFPWFGTGVGSHRSVYRTFMEKDHEVEFAYAESSFVHLLLETGRLGMGLLVLAIVWTGVCFLRIARSGMPNAMDLAIVCLSGLLSSCCQAVADFVWQIPSCCVSVLLLLAVLWRLPRIANQFQSTSVQRDPSSGVERDLAGAPLTLATGLAFLLFLWGSISIPAARASLAWHEYLHLPTDSSTVSAVPANAQEPLDIGLNEKSRLLRCALKHDPTDPRIHERLMLLYWQALCRHPEFVSTELHATLLTDLDIEARRVWLKSVLGPKFCLLTAAEKHADFTIHSAPLSGRAYLVKAIANRLLLGQTHQSLLCQARTARPFDPFIHMREGVWRLLATDLDGALASWLLAAKCDSNDRHGIAQTIAQAVPVEKIVEQVSANEVLLRRIYYIYLRQGQQENQRIIRDCYAACLASTWLSTHDAGQCADYQNVLSHMHLDLHDASQAQLAAAEVVKLRPTDFSARKWLAQVAGMNQDYSTALKHIKWCRSRDPESLELAELESGLQRSAVQRGQRR